MMSETHDCRAQWAALSQAEQQLLGIVWATPYSRLSEAAENAAILEMGASAWNAATTALSALRDPPLIDHLRTLVGDEDDGYPGPYEWGLTFEGRVLMTRLQGLDPMGVDSVTGLLVHDSMTPDLARCVAEATNGQPASLVMVDLDHFKALNDRYGHLGGNKALRYVGDALRNVAEGKGRCYRWGGEELAVCLPNHSAMEAAAVAERARCSIENLIIPWENQEMVVTASFGVAESPRDGSNPTDLTKAADKALYSAKDGGRNRVCVFVAAVTPTSPMP